MITEVITIRGKVDFYHDGKKYGFIQPEEGGDEDIFFHISNIEGEEVVQEGDDVEFETEPGDQGPEAVDIQVV